MAFAVFARHEQLPAGHLDLFCSLKRQPCVRCCPCLDVIFVQVHVAVSEWIRQNHPHSCGAFAEPQHRSVETKTWLLGSCPWTECSAPLRHCAQHMSTFGAQRSTGAPLSPTLLQTPTLPLGLLFAAERSAAWHSGSVAAYLAQRPLSEHGSTAVPLIDCTSARSCLFLSSLSVALPIPSC